MYNQIIFEIKYISGEMLYSQMYPAGSNHMEKTEIKGLDTTIQDISIHDTGVDIHSV